MSEKYMGLINLETRAGNAIRAGQRHIVPVSRALTLTIPGKGGLIWNRPVSVTVRDEDGSEYSLPVNNRTRRKKMALMGVAACLLLLTKTMHAGHFRQDGR